MDEKFIKFFYKCFFNVISLENSFIDLWHLSSYSVYEHMWSDNYP